MVSCLVFVYWLSILRGGISVLRWEVYMSSLWTYLWGVLWGTIHINRLWVRLSRRRLDWLVLYFLLWRAIMDRSVLRMPIINAELEWRILFTLPRKSGMAGWRLWLPSIKTFMGWRKVLILSVRNGLDRINLCVSSDFWTKQWIMYSKVSKRLFLEWLLLYSFPFLPVFRGNCTVCSWRKRRRWTNRYCQEWNSLKDSKLAWRIIWTICGSDHYHQCDSLV